MLFQSLLMSNVFLKSSFKIKFCSKASLSGTCNLPGLENKISTLKTKRTLFYGNLKLSLHKSGPSRKYGIIWSIVTLESMNEVNWFILIKKLMCLGHQILVSETTITKPFWRSWNQGFAVLKLQAIRIIILVETPLVSVVFCTQTGASRQPRWLSDLKIILITD